MAMTLGELIEALTDLRDSHSEGDTLEVRIAYQRNYPLAATVLGVADSSDFDVDMDDVATIPTVEPVVWIATGEVGWDENPYATEQVWANAY